MVSDHATSAYRLGRLGAWGPVDPGDLVLHGGTLTFTSHSQGIVFSAHVTELSVTVPRLLLRAAIVVRVDGRKHRLSFIRLDSAAGTTDLDGDTIVAGNQFDLSAVAPARAVASDWLQRLRS
jgi:hypothetical protein